jgi:hypothetical protein
MLNEYEQQELDTLINADEESSKTIWETFVNASLEVLLSYAIHKFGKDKVREKVKTMT